MAKKKKAKSKKIDKNLVIVESPAKAKTIERYLGSEYRVRATVGHVIDLPKSNIAVDIENEFEPNFVTIKGKGALLKKLAKDVPTEGKGEVFLAMDPDREGEAIAWHVANALKLKNPKRIVFHEITKTAVNEAIKKPTKIDEQPNALGKIPAVILYNQRTSKKGIGISDANPLYVVKIVADKNEIIVGAKKHLIKTKINLKDLNIITNDQNDFTKELFDLAETRLQNAEFEAAQTPFGYFLDLEIKAPGYSLARIWASL